MSLRILVVITVLTVIARSSNGQVPIRDFFRFGEANGDTNLKTVIGNGDLDDGSSPELSLQKPFKFFGTSITSLYVNVNGLVSFKRPIRERTGNCDSLSENMSMIAPFWSEVDLNTDRTPSPGGVFYRQTTDKIDLDKALLDVKDALPNMEYLANLEWAFIATWYKVGFRSTEVNSTKKTNTFQMAMVTGGQYSFVILNYNNIEWTAGHTPDKDGFNEDAARAGYDNGLGKFYNIPGSCQADIINITKINLNYVPGKFVLRLDGETIVPTSTTTVKGSTVTKTPTTITTSSYSTIPPKPTLIPSSTSIPDQIKEQKDKLEQKLNGFRVRVKALCILLSNRRALERSCYIDMDEVDKMLLELPLVKNVDELKRVDDYYHVIADDINKIEKDISL